MVLGNGAYIGLIVVGVLVTFAVGALLFRSGEPFLEEVFQRKEVARSMNLLLTVLFHLLTLAVLALISLIPPPDGIGVAETIVFKFGVVLLVVGIAYGVSLLVLLRIRERRRQTAMSAQISEQLAEQRQSREPGRVRRTVPKTASPPTDVPSD